MRPRLVFAVGSLWHKLAIRKSCAILILHAGKSLFKLRAKWNPWFISIFHLAWSLNFAKCEFGFAWSMLLCKGRAINSHLVFGMEHAFCKGHAIPPNLGMVGTILAEDPRRFFSKQQSQLYHFRVLDKLLSPCHNQTTSRRTYQQVIHSLTFQ